MLSDTDLCPCCNHIAAKHYIQQETANNFIGEVVPIDSKIGYMTYHPGCVECEYINYDADYTVSTCSCLYFEDPYSDPEYSIVYLV